MCKTYAWSFHVLSKEVSQYIYIYAESVYLYLFCGTYVSSKKNSSTHHEAVFRDSAKAEKKHQASQRFENYGHALSNVRWRKVIASWISGNSRHKGFLADCESMLHVNLELSLTESCLYVWEFHLIPKKLRILVHSLHWSSCCISATRPTNVTQQAGHGKSKPQEFWLTFLYHIHVTEKRCICIIVCNKKITSIPLSP